METVICFLCRVTFQERQGLKDHLIYEHGVMYNLTVEVYAYITSMSL